MTNVNDGIAGNPAIQAKTTFSEIKYRPDIDGLRSLAVSSVIAYHAGIPLITGGFIGVDVFFAISGYLIGSIIYREIVAANFSFKRFYTRRARRILPALFTLLAFASVAAWLLLTPLELVQYVKAALTTVFATSNITFWLGTNYFSPAAELNPLLMTWSLGVEEQFYLLVPALMLIVFRLWPKRVSLAVTSISLASLLISFWATAKYPTASFFLLPTRAWELGAGMLLAIYEYHNANSKLSTRGKLTEAIGLIGFSMVATALFAFNANTLFPGVAAVLPVTGSVLMLASRKSAINRLLLASRPLVFVGKMSYSWYLWHWPLLSFARICSDKPLALSTALVIVAMSFAAAFLSWRFVEQPFRYRKSDGIATLRGYLTATAAMVLLVGTLGFHHGWPQRFNASLSTIERNSLSITRDPCILGYGSTSPNLSPICVPVSVKHPTIALMGDSHAGALGGALRKYAAASGYDFIQLTKSSCPALIGLTRRMPNHIRHESECASYNAKAFQIVFSRPSVKIVVLAGFWSAPFIEEENGSRFTLTSEATKNVSTAQSRENLESALMNTIHKLRTARKRVVLVQDVPMYAFDPLRHAETDFIPARLAIRNIMSPNSQIGFRSASVSQVINWQDISAAILDRVIARNPDVTVLNLRKSFCNENRCTFADESSVFYVDYQHLSFSGARHAIDSVRLFNAKTL